MVPAAVVEVAAPGETKREGRGVSSALAPPLAAGVASEGRDAGEESRGEEATGEESRDAGEHSAMPWASAPAVLVLAACASVSAPASVRGSWLGLG